MSEQIRNKTIAAVMAGDRTAFDALFEQNEAAMVQFFACMPRKGRSKSDAKMEQLMQAIGLTEQTCKENRREALWQECQDYVNSRGSKPKPLSVGGVMLPGARVNRGPSSFVQVATVRKPKRRKAKAKRKPIRRLSEYGMIELGKLQRELPMVRNIDADMLQHFGIWRGGLVELDSHGRPIPNA